MPKTRGPSKEEKGPLQLTEARETAQRKLEARIAEGAVLLERKIASEQEAQGFMEHCDAWESYNARLLLTLFTNDEIERRHAYAGPVPTMLFRQPTIFEQAEGASERIRARLAVLRSVIQELELFPTPVVDVDRGARRGPIEVLEHLTDRFHKVARQLRRRHANRGTLEITDEYDVQDPLHALLLLEFEDVRPEEWTPSYAGRASRMDFLLRRERIVIEAKCSRVGLGSREVGEELLIDIAKYQRHPDCGSLFCFVYDPAGQITNPRGLEDDLSHDRHGLPTVVRVRPHS